MIALMKAPKSISVPGTTRPEMPVPPPVIALMRGLMMLVVSAVTMPVNAPPMMTPTAMSITLPRMTNSLNSDANFFMSRPPRLAFMPRAGAALQQISDHRSARQRACHARLGRLSSSVSSQTVTGPSFSSETCMSAPKTPRPTWRTLFSARPQKCS